MIPRWLLLVVGLLLGVAQPAAAKDHSPDITTTKLDGEPSYPFYFEDTETILLRDSDSQSVHVSFDGGKEWEVLKGENGTMEGSVNAIYPHQFDNHRAYLLGAHGTLWVTTDQAKTWDLREIPAMPRLDRPLSFNGWDPQKVIFRGEKCSITMCMPVTYYTIDDFKTVKPLRDMTDECVWAAGTPEFGQDVDVSKSLGDRVFCVVPPLKLPFHPPSRLVFSDDFFQGDDEGTEVKLEHGRPVSGVGKIGAVKKSLIVVVRSQGTTELALYVSDDSTEWHRAEFMGQRVEQDSYTVLESTNYSIQIDVETSRHRMGVLFTSNSNGTYFTPNIEHTNRESSLGRVDFEKVADIQGIVMINTVKNWEEVQDSDSEKKEIVSNISFDDGRTFLNLNADGETLHLHSMTTYTTLKKVVGRIFSSPAPGIVMGVGNTGKYLKDYEDGDLYVSDDAGVNWERALHGPHRFEFGDQGGVIIAVPDKKTDKVLFSINHGRDWEEVELKHKITPKYVVTTPDATSLKFLLIGSTGDDEKFLVYSIDFGGLHERKCKESDFEPWVARLDENRKPDCLMGHQQTYKRRKSDAECFVKELFKELKPTFEPCKCTAEDFECDYNFIRSEDRKECIPAVPLTVPAGECKKADDKYKGPSGWRLIPGNACIREGGENLDREIERSCGNATETPIADGKVIWSKTPFSAQPVQHYYLERQTSSQGDDETVVMLTSDSELHVSHDHGKNWEQPLEGERIQRIILPRYYSDAAFFLTEGKTVYYTLDRAQTPLPHFTAPCPPTKENLSPLSFHEKYPRWLLWTGHGEGSDSSTYRSDVYLSKNRGLDWGSAPLLLAVGHCEFASRDDRNNSDQLVLCAQFEKESRQSKNQLLLSSDDWFETNPTVLFDKVAQFATMEEFIVVASHAPDVETKYLNASSSVDGRIFAAAHFPFNLDVPVYTVLPGSTHALFLHVTVNEELGYGSLVKSNSNGTSFVLSLNAVNRDEKGFADFEKMTGLEGVALANVVANVDEMKKGAAKKLRSMITHNDGAQWTYLPPPAQDADGKKYSCGVTEGRGTEKCALHLHSYTERKGTFSSASAIGMMVGVGNVGDHLTNLDEGDTFITTDGGITWRCAKKGQHRWEYGDSGSLIVLVPEKQPSKIGYYSIDEGNSWKDFTFSDEDMEIEDISTVPSDTSKRFLLWGKDAKSGTSATVSLDFSGLRNRECHLDEGSEESEDYYLWTPKHPQQKGNCLFGHVEQYHRKKPTADCWNNWPEPHIHSISDNCSCTRADFEW